MTAPVQSLPIRAIDANRLENASFEELAKANPEAANAARQFEAVFLRQLLSCVEKSTGLGKGSETQGAVVGSMVVGAMSDEMSTAGGIGLSDVILRAMLQNEPLHDGGNGAKSVSSPPEAGPPINPHPQ